MKPRKIKSVWFAWVDPWTGEWLAGSGDPWSWDKQKAARSFYSIMIRRMRTVAKEWSGLRNPKLMLKLTYE